MLWRSSRGRPLNAPAGFLILKGSLLSFRALQRMDRHMLIDHLAQAERHIAEGRAHVESERQIVEGLVRGGHDARKSQDLLELFEDTLAMHVEERDRLLSELTESTF